MAVKHVTDLQVVQAVAQYQAEMKAHDGGPLYPRFPYEVLSEDTGQCQKVCYRAMERADRHDLLEWGVSLRTAWLTDKGRELLESSGVIASIKPMH